MKAAQLITHLQVCLYPPLFFLILHTFETGYPAYKFINKYKKNFSLPVGSATFQKPFLVVSFSAEVETTNQGQAKE